jgi:hypothetical protein
MTDYAARFDCIDSVIDFSQPANGITLALDEAVGLTESKVFVNTGTGQAHSALDMVGAWLTTHRFQDHNELALALFAPGSEDKFTMFRIERPKGAGDTGFAEFEVALDVVDSWSVKTNQGLKPAVKIRLAMRLSLEPVH